MKCLEFDQIRTEKVIKSCQKNIAREKKIGLFIPRPQNRDDDYRSGVMSSALFRFFSFKRPVLVKLLIWSFFRFVFFFDLCCCLVLAMDGRTDRHFHKDARVQ